MTQLPRVLLNVASLLLFLGALALSFAQTHVQTTLEVLGSTYLLSLTTAMMISALLVGASVGLKLLEQISQIRQGARKSERQREKAEVTAEASSDKVKALEAKVETLEKALAKALEKASKSPLT